PSSPFSSSKISCSKISWPPRIPLSLEAGLLRVRFAGLACRFREQRKHRENKGLSLEIVVCGIACRAGDLFPYLRQPCKARQVCIDAGIRSDALADPAFDAIDEGRKRRAIAEGKLLAERMQLARVDL